jgi:hypothetical protein
MTRFLSGACPARYALARDLLAPVTAIGVERLITSPFCAVNYLPWGRLSSKLSKGTSGVALKVLVVIPPLIEVEPTSSTVTP